MRTIKQCLVLFLIALVGSFRFCTAQAQTVQIDSLRAIISSNVHDSTRTKAWLRLAVEYRASDKEMELRCFSEALTLTEKVLETAKGKLQKRMLLFKSAALNNQGSIFYNEGQFFEALDKYYASLPISEKLENKLLVAQTLQNIGIIHIIQGEFETALNHLNRCLELHIEEADTIQMLDSYLLLGGLHQDIAFEAYENGDSSAGDVARERAITALENCIHWSVLANIDQGNAYALLGLAEFYEFDGNDSLALKKIGQALNLFDRVGDPIGSGVSMMQMGSLLLDLGKVDRALKLASRSYELACENDIIMDILDASTLLAEVHTVTGNHREALEMYKLSQSIRDSIQNDELGRKVLREQMKHESDQKKAIIALLEKDQQLQALELANSNKWATVFGLIAGVLVLIILLIIYFSFQLRKSKRSIERTKNELETTQDELLQLNATKDKFFAIIAHDIQSFSSSFLGLGVMIKDYIQNKAYDKAESLVDDLDSEATRLDSLIDNLLSWALSQLNRVPYRPQAIPVDQIMDEMLAIFSNFASAKNITLHSSIQAGSTVYADPNALQLVFRNLLSNAIKFSQTGDKIDVSARTTSNMLEISVADTGSGIAKNRLESLLTSILPESTKGSKGEKGTGLGLVLCREFLKINKGELRIESTLGKGSIFSFTLPVQA